MSKTTRRAGLVYSILIFIKVLNFSIRAQFYTETFRKYNQSCDSVCMSVTVFFSRFFRVNLIGRKNESIYFTLSDSLIYIRANSTNLYVNILFHVYQNFQRLLYVPLVSQYLFHDYQNFHRLLYVPMIYSYLLYVSPVRTYGK